MPEPASAQFLSSIAAAASRSARCMASRNFLHFPKRSRPYENFETDSLHSRFTKPPIPSRSVMKIFPASGLTCALLLFHLSGASSPVPDGSKADGVLFGFRDASQELKAETRFLAVPDPKLAED